MNGRTGEVPYDCAGRLDAKSTKPMTDINERIAELQYEAGMYQSLYENAIERCAKIAEPWSGFAGADKMGVQDREIIKVRQEIAAAIRSLSISSADRGTP